jgi:hypothetical protein
MELYDEIHGSRPQLGRSAVEMALLARLDGKAFQPVWVADRQQRPNPIILYDNNFTSIVTILRTT